jgi:hypothetical protein
MANPPISRGNQITAEQFNELVALYHTHWSDDNPMLSFNDLLADQSAENINLHATGWGQSQVEPTVVQTEIITSTQTNRLINQINAGTFHLNSSNFNYTSLTTYAAGSVILYEAYKEKIETAIDYLDGQSLDIDTVYSSELVMEDEGGIFPYNDTVVWTSLTSTTTKVTFSSYRQARYFFNSGGKIVFDMSCIGDEDWTRVLNNMGTLMIGATEWVNSIVGGSYVATGGVYSAGSLGNPIASFMYSDSGGDYGGDYGGAYGGAYGGGAYSSRRVYFYSEGNELPGGEFEIYFTISLIDPNGTPINIDASLNVGYLLPIDTPPLSILDSSVGNKFKTDLYVYQFIEREKPMISIDSYWT